MDPSALRVIALCSCILGAFFVAKSVSTKTPKYMLHELLRFKVNRIRFFRKYVTQKLEAIVGFVFLFVGFALQIYLEVQALRAEPTPPAGLTSVPTVIGITVAVMALIALILNRTCAYFSSKIFVELMRFMVNRHGYALESDESLLLELGKAMRVRREDEDTIESYANKVIKRMKLTPPGPDPEAPL